MAIRAPDGANKRLIPSEEAYIDVEGNQVKYLIPSLWGVVGPLTLPY